MDTALIKLLSLKTFFLLVCFSALILLLDARGALDPVHSVASVAVMPVQYAFYQGRLGLENVFSFATFWRSGEARIKNLEQRNLELVAFKNKAEILERENGELRKQLGAPLRQDFAGQEKLLPAPVVLAGSFLELEVGRADGVKEGASVIYLSNLVGRVVKVLDHSSLVELPTSSQSKIPVRIGLVSGLVFGQFNSTIVLSQVAANEELNVGDLVVTSGEAGSFVPNLIVGKIEKITSLETDLFKMAEVGALIDYKKLTTVFVKL